METQVNQVALPLRSHTILGVCEAIGEDFGFNPVFLRIPLATMVIVSPTLAFSARMPPTSTVICGAVSRSMKERSSSPVSGDNVSSAAW